MQFFHSYSSFSFSTSYYFKICSSWRTEKFQNLGELSLAHNGVLFLDEFLEFKTEILELLRTPLEDNQITISRLTNTFTFPCNFMLIASTNPCPCGYYGSKEKECTCTQEQIKKYQQKLSGPLLDRIDIQIEVPFIPYSSISTTRKTESSAKIQQRVNRARAIQIKRYTNDGIYTNSQLTTLLIQKYCKLDEECQQLLKNAFNQFKFSARAYNRILKLARTIADLSESKNIKINHLAEAIQYRTLDRKYWS